MFSLGLSPAFRKKRLAFLSEKTLPSVALPTDVERCISILGPGTNLGIHRGATPWALWKATLGSMRSLLWRTALFSLLAASAASFSTLAGTRILERASTSANVAYGFALVYFLMNWTSRFGMFQSDRLRSWVGLGGEAYLAGLVTQKLVRLSPLAAERQSSGNLKVLVTSDVKNVGVLLDNAVRNLLPTLVALLVVSPMIAYFGGRAGLVGIGILILILPITFGLNRISSYFQDRGQTELDHLTTLVGEWVSNIRLIRYLSWESKIESDVSAQTRKYMKFGIGQHFMACVIFGLSSSWWMVSAGGVLAAGAWLTGGIDTKGFFGSLWLLSYLASYLTHVPNTIRQYGVAAPSMRRIAEFLSEEERGSLIAAKAPDTASLGEIRKIHFKEVDFTYPGGTKPVISGLNIQFDLGKQVALLGEIGSGKSTLLKLLAGEYPPTRGTIFVEDAAGRTAPLWSEGVYDEFRSKLASVPQEPFVAHDLFANNIALSDDGSESALIEAAYFAELEADLRFLPLGLKQEIGESGVNLSGGQRQRLNLARAVFAERPYLVLDDTLSAVDLKTEAKLMSALRGRAGGFVLVTHRIQELGAVDRVYVLREGKVVEEGLPGDLAKDRNSAFSRVLRAYEEKEKNG